MTRKRPTWVPRARPAQTSPPADLEGFPHYLVEVGTWYREHRARPDVEDGGCWYFSSRAVDVAPAGRFDLLDPDGTCYLAETEGAAARERCGRLLAYGMAIPSGHIKDRVVSQVSLPGTMTPIADIATAKAVPFQVTAELSAAPDSYEVAVEWADAFRRTGFRGIRYTPRFTPGGDESAMALFDRAGARSDYGRLRHRPLADVLDDLGYRREMVDIPDSFQAIVDDDTPATA